MGGLSRNSVVKELTAKGSQGELIVYLSSWRPSVSLSIKTLNYEYLHNHKDDRNQI